MSPLVRRVSRTIRQRGLAADGDRIAVAVSGGSDSVALAWVLTDLAHRARWRVVGLVHVNHGLRGTESDADEAFCRALAARLGLPIEVARADVDREARPHRHSLETAARLARYACLERAAGVLNATTVATGHTQDDQAETVLLRLLRGAGSRGVSAIRPRRGPYIRPLIDCRRADLIAELGARGEAWRTDQSNLDVRVPRNRLRHQILPIMAETWPGAVPALARFAEQSADDEAFLTKTAVDVAHALTLSGPAGVQVLDVRGLVQLPAALARRIIRGAIEAADGTPSFRHVEDVRRLARADRTQGHLDLGGLSVERTGPALKFIGPRPAGRVGAPFEYALPVPGRADVIETGTVIQASLGRGSAAMSRLGGEACAVVQADSVSVPLVVRNRRPGDRLRPFGSPGSRKLQDVFVDRKVPREERDRVPLVVDAAGRIVWVVGVTIADECRVTAPESGVVILETRKGIR